MKSIILFVAFSFLISPAFSQVSIGVTGGYSLARFHEGRTEGSEYRSNPLKSGWHAGFTVEKKLAGNFYLQPQILVSAKGGKSIYEHSDTMYHNDEFNASTMYLEVPLNVVYKFKRWYVGAGPYIAHGLGGKGTRDSLNAIPGVYVEEFRTWGKIRYYGDASGLAYKGLDMRWFDWGFNFIGGYELKNGLFFSGNYSMGLAGIYGRGSKMTNRYWGVSVGYYFKRFG